MITTMHILKVTYELQFDVRKMIELSRDLPVKRMRLKSFKIPRTRKTGFSKRRYEQTDTKYPVLVDSDHLVLDGRHRLAKMQDHGRRTCLVRVVPYEVIAKCLLPDPAIEQLRTIIRGRCGRAARGK